MTTQDQNETQSPRSRIWIAIVPLAIFAAIALLFWRGLGAGDPSKLPSALIGKAAPDVALPALENLAGPAGPVPGLDPAAFKGAVTVVNVWASWCIPCHEEAPLFMKVAQDKRIRVVGVNYKDQPDKALNFLKRYGNPFAAVGVDANGRAGIEWGVYGVPETFIVGRDGTIAYKLVGPLTPDNIDTVLRPQIDKALAKG
ncbi:MAG TPA: DsbE family thiol:disulfide interchange protein [Rhodoblastus sp.]|nr:DsbE family thiol:disulfide interchange protein [Rhodoblastus sp.]